MEGVDELENEAWVGVVNETGGGVGKRSDVTAGEIDTVGVEEGKGMKVAGEKVGAEPVGLPKVGIDISRLAGEEIGVGEGEEIINEEDAEANLEEVGRVFENCKWRHGCLVLVSR